MFSGSCDLSLKRHGTEVLKTSHRICASFAATLFHPTVDSGSSLPLGRFQVRREQSQAGSKVKMHLLDDLNVDTRVKGLSLMFLPEPLSSVSSSFFATTRQIPRRGHTVVGVS